MQEAIIKDTKLTFVDPLIVERYSTDLIILDDLTGLNVPNDASAEEINKVFKEKGKTGIGYHYVIRKNGTIEEGLPSFARGFISKEDWHAINIVICGKFSQEELTSNQIEMTAMLLANLTDKYKIITSTDNIISKQSFMNSISPGRDLNEKIDIIVGKANWYRYKGGPEQQTMKTLDDSMISEHFAKSEFWCHGEEQCTCTCHHSLEINPRLIELVEQLRSNIGGYPLYINSGYRCPMHNAYVGGVSNSQHKLGNAADIARPEHLSFGQFQWYVEQLPFDGIGLYYAGDFIHCDVRDNGIGSHIVFYGA